MPPITTAETEKAAYRYDRATGHFLPANDAAWREIHAWNDWAHATMVRLGTLPPHWGEHVNVD